MPINLINFLLNPFSCFSCLRACGRDGNDTGGRRKSPAALGAFGSVQTSGRTRSYLLKTLANLRKHTLKS